ncbi:hypothetical protein Pse7367_1885 [Thalassoporum mexicanum PCC 7367]|uniref:DUF3110 domain-containing protein n=1 Tax=Thalassoporum mexicanum TaxID=3457544 RepID=UPI00029FA6AA|nr:DUF3110 domain-containing protein [Pseudanabaena sp. PCC 7367]AFY70161.1 hypothetical protein Pse7367_1885 [Pseudanabaena sp. PCC 7367]
MQVWILQFNINDLEQAFYALSLSDGQTVIIAFEDQEDADRCSGLLEAQDFPDLSPEQIEQKELEEICSDSGCQLYVVKSGEFFMPTEENADPSEWQLEDEAASATTPATNANTNDSSNGAEAAEIEKMRQRLENLLNP